MPARSTGLGSSPCGIAGDRRTCVCSRFRPAAPISLAKALEPPWGSPSRPVVREASGTVGVVIERWRLRALTLDKAKREVDQGNWVRGGVEPNGFEIVDDEGSILARRSYTGPPIYPRGPERRKCPPRALGG